LHAETTQQASKRNEGLSMQHEDTTHAPSTGWNRGPCGGGSCSKQNPDAKTARKRWRERRPRPGPEPITETPCGKDKGSPAGGSPDPTNGPRAPRQRGELEPPRATLSHKNNAWQALCTKSTNLPLSPSRVVETWTFPRIYVERPVDSTRTASARAYAH